MISSKFPKSFRGARDLAVLSESLIILKTRKITKKLVRHHQVTSSPKTLQKLAWNHLTVFLLNFEKNRRLLFAFQPPTQPNVSEKLKWDFSTIFFARSVFRNHPQPKLCASASITREKLHSWTRWKVTRQKRTLMKLFPQERVFQTNFQWNRTLDWITLPPNGKIAKKQDCRLAVWKKCNYRQFFSLTG